MFLLDWRRGLSDLALPNLTGVHHNPRPLSRGQYLSNQTVSSGKYDHIEGSVSEKPLN